MPTDDYIKRSEVVEELCGQCRFYDSSNDCGLKICSAYPRKELINAIPAADVETVRHGRWIERMLDKFRKYECACSECGAKYIGNYDQYCEPSEFLYCPNCGAKMMGEEDDVHER